MADDRRKGDDRPFVHAEGVSLTFLPAEDRPFRWLPKNGQPYCIGEWLTQHTVRFISWLPIYSAIVVTGILIIQIWHPFGLGK